MVQLPCCIAGTGPFQGMATCWRAPGRVGSAGPERRDLNEAACMLVELVETTTRDGVTLHGAYQPAEASREPGTLPLDAVLLLHGVGSNFYGSPLLARLSAAFAQRGVSALRVNTRGHDMISVARTAAGPWRQGAAFEVVGQCVEDIEGWSDFLEQRFAEKHGVERARGCRVGLLGHSLGAVKAIYAAALGPRQTTRAVVGLSPPQLSHAGFMRHARRKLFARTCRRAREMVDAGKPDTLMRVSYPFPLLITAAGYLEKYGPAEKYNLLRFVDRLPCPALVTFGQLEVASGSAAFADLPRELRNLSSVASPLQTVTIAAANHLYDGCGDVLTREIFKWLEKLGGRSAAGSSSGAQPE